MAQTYGEIFKQTREAAGLSLRDISDQLRVREDILEALENGDFDRIPPQGYARNMVKSYSRLLGLDGQQMTMNFLDCEHAYRLTKSRIKQESIINENQRRYSRSSAQTGSFRTPRQQLNYENQNPAQTQSISSANTSRFGRINTNRPNSYVSSATTKNRPISSTSTTNFGQARRPSRLNVSSTFTGSSNENGNARERIQARQNRNLQQAKAAAAQKNEQSKGRFGSTFNANREKRAEFHTDAEELPKTQPVSERVNFQNMHVFGAGSPNMSNTKKPKFNVFLIGVGVVVLIIVLVLVLFLVGRTSSNSKNDYSQTPITGLNDTEKITNGTSSDNSSSNESTSSKTIPTEVELKYSVVNGMSTYMEVYENNSSKPSLARTVTSGQTGSFKTSSTIKVVVVNPKAVNLTVDGATVTPTDTNKTGVYTYTLNFATWLSEWKTKNGVV